MELALQIIISLICAVISSLCCGRLLQILQLSSYRVGGLITWLKQTRGDYIARYFSLGFFTFLPMLMFWICFGRYRFVCYLGLLIFIAIGILFIFITFKQFKVPLKVTPRMLRIMIMLGILFFAAYFPFVYFAQKVWVLGYSPIGLIVFLAPLFVMIANYIMFPFERLNNRRFLKRANAKLESIPGLIKIGITGSYGKTTAKNILACMLAKNYKVCKSPSSYNTLMGLCRTVNEVLETDDEVFIAEMGARFVGDIKELTELIKPQCGIITAVGDMHLETFGTRETVAKAKYELIESLNKNGIAVFNGENEYGKVFYDKTECIKFITCSEESEIKAFYENVNFTPYGTEFELLLNDQRCFIRTKLLGKHIPSLIAQCAILAFKLGVTPSDIAEACAEIEQIPHRLQLIKNGNVTIIDDSFNSNPEGANNAIELLGSFKGTKIVVTPGMIELGDIQSSCNAKLGAIAASNADLIIAIGSNAKDIIKGATEKGMDAEKIIKCDTLNDASAIIGNLPPNEYVILYENDLPDNH